MCLPANLLASLEFSSVTSARASEDNFPGSDASSGRWKIGYGALLMWPLRLRPFLDVIWTAEHEPGQPCVGFVPLSYCITRTCVTLAFFSCSVHHPHRCNVNNSAPVHVIASLLLFFVASLLLLPQESSECACTQHPRCFTDGLRNTSSRTLNPSLRVTQIQREPKLD